MSKAIFSKKKIIIVLAIIVMAFSSSGIVKANNNPLLTGGVYKDRYGSSYWPTSAIREWLNDSSTNTKYTNGNASSIGYEREGFLNQFSQKELDGIAVTERRAFVHSNTGSGAREGGNRDVPRYDGLVPTILFHVASPDIDKVWNQVYYQTLNERVFVLAPHELYEYVQKRGKTFRKKRSDNGNYTTYWTSSYNYSNNNSETMWAINAEGKTIAATNNGTYGVVPAIHLKPNYQLENGKLGNQLNIGDEVTFGKFKGKPIVWEVINKTPEGFPLLWSKDILDMKRYSVPTTTLYRNSESFTLPTYDISIKSNLKYTNGHQDTTEPYLKIINEEVLNVRQNSSFNIRVQAFDNTDGSGIDHIILPNGSKHNGDTINYRIERNGRYEFIAVDKANNHYGFEVPIGNFNPPASVLINQSETDWTNKDVIIDIITNESNTDWEVPLKKVARASGVGFTFPEFTTYSGKRIKIEGKVRKIRNDTNTNHNVVIRMDYDYIRKLGNNYGVARTYPVAYQIPINNLSTSTYTDFNFVYTVPTNYFEKLTPTMGVSLSAINANVAEVEWKDVKISLLDKEDFKIDKIILPDNREIQAETYKDSLSKSGTYTYKVLDNRGMITQRTIEVKIDKIKPNLSIQPNTTQITHDDVVLNAVGTDEGGSGVKRIQTPNGQWIDGNKASFTVKENGSYTFIVEDHAGNQSSKVYSVTNIDKTISFDKPDISSFGNYTLQDKPETITTEITPIIIKDWREGTNKWKVDVAASPMKLVGESFYLPKGSLKLKPLSNITRSSGSGSLPTKGFETSQVIDSGKITVIQGNNSRGEYNAIFPKGALELLIDPTTAKKGKYESTITWDLISAP